MPKTNPKPKRSTPSRAVAPTGAAALRRKNIRLALILVGVALGFAVSVFAWRMCHHQPPIPQGGTYGETFHPQPQAQE